MPDVRMVESVDVPANGAGNGVLEASPNGVQRLANGQFPVGWRGGPGRPVGSKNAAKCLDRAAPKLARHMIARSFKSDHVLCKTMDKILPDATVADQAGGVVPIFVIVGPRSVEAGGMSGRLSDAGQETGEAVVPRLLDAEPSAGTEHG